MQSQTFISTLVIRLLLLYLSLRLNVFRALIAILQVHIASWSLLEISFIWESKLQFPRVRSVHF